MEFAVVDIETTGGHAASNSITEIAIAIHNGVDIIDYYESLVKPDHPIPFFIQKLTGITNDMVSNAPTFEDISRTVFDLLQGRVFVAHNVNFDYSFVQSHLHRSGYQLKSKKLCTIRASKEIFPNLPAYGLGKITNFLGIEHKDKHRAGGDTKATAQLLSMLVAEDKNQVIYKMIGARSGDQYIPPLVHKKDFKTLPSLPGVYYFHNSKGQIIYIGKAINLKKRVISHFANNKTNATKQMFLKEVAKVTHRILGSDLLASIVESFEIRSKWPIYNRDQKGYQPKYSIVTYEDRLKRKRLAVKRIPKGMVVLSNIYNTQFEARKIVERLASINGLCAATCNLSKKDVCHLHPNGNCSEECVAEHIDSHNKKMDEAISQLAFGDSSFALKDKGRYPNEHSFVLVKNGSVKGIGFLTNSTQFSHYEQFESIAEPIEENDLIRHLVFKKAQIDPESIFYF